MSNPELRPFKDPPAPVMEQSLNLAIQEETTHEQNVDDFKQGRHLQRLAVAREFASGRPLIDFIRAVESSETTIRELLVEARNLGLIEGTNLRHGEGWHTQLSQALSTKRAAAALAREPEEDKELLKQEIVALHSRHEAQQQRAEELIKRAKQRLAEKKGIKPKPDAPPTAEELAQLKQQREQAHYLKLAKETNQQLKEMVLHMEREEIKPALQEIFDLLISAGFTPEDNRL